MYSLISLTTNEWLKITKRKFFIISLIIIAAVSLGAALFINLVMKVDTLTVGQFAPNMIGLSGGGFVYLILTAVLASGMVSKEHQLGTIKLLLIRAHSRNKIMASKFLAIIIYMVVIGLYTLLVSYIVGLFMFSNDGLQLGQAIEEFAYTLIYTFSFVAIAMMCSTLTKSTGATIGIVLGLTIVESIIVGLLYNYKFAKFILFFNTNFSQFTAGDRPIIEELTPLFSAIVYSIYMIVFIAITFIVFKKRDVA